MVRVLASLILLIGGLLIAAPFLVPVEEEAPQTPAQSQDQGEPVVRHEPLRGGLRNVTPEEMTQPPEISGETLTRLPAAAPPPAPARPPKPVSFALPRVVAAGVIISGETQITLAGIEPLASDARCKDGAGNWPCGALAKTALQRLIRQRTIECDPMSGESSKSLVTSCRVGGEDIAAWLVRQGWAVPAGSQLAALLEEAKAAGRGQWGSRPE